MATFEDLHPNQNPTLFGVQMDLGRMAENVATLIADWRAMAAASVDPRPNMTAVANGLLGRLRRAFDFLSANPSELSGISSRLGVTDQAALDAITARANTLIAFRDATKNTIAQAKAAVDNLAAGFPAPKPASSTTLFLSSPLPTTW